MELRAIFILLLLFVSACTTVNKSAQRDISKEFGEWCNSKGFKGSIALVQNGELIINKSCNTSIKEPVYPIGSLSKSFTAALIHGLINQNKIAIDDKVSKHLPKSIALNFDPNVSIRDLLNHQSKIPDFTKQKGFWSLNPKEASPKKILTLLKGKKGISGVRKFRYNNSNYLLLTQIIEIFEQMTYENVVINKIVRPLNLKNTGSFVQVKTNSIVPGERANKKSEVVKVKDTELFTNYSGAGSIFSSSSDLAFWAYSLLNGKVVKGLSADTILKESGKTPHGFRYGSGWIVGGSTDGEYWHTGGTPGHTARVSFFPNRKTVIVILSAKEKSQIGRPPNDKMVASIKEILFRK